MPIEIPTYISRTAPRVVDRGATSPAATGLPVAEGMMKLGIALAESDLAFRAGAAEIERAQALAAVDVGARRQIKDLETSLAQDPDWQTYDQRWTSGFTKIKTGILSGVNDPALKKAAIIHLGTLEGEGFMRAAGKSRQMAADNFEAFRLTSRKNTLDSLSVVTDPQDEAAVIGMHMGVIAAQEQGGWLAPDKAVKEKQDFIQDVHVSRAKKDILSNPSVYFQKRKEGAYSGIDIGKIDLLDAQAVRQVEHVNRIAEQQVKKAQEKNSAVFLAGVDAGTVGDAEADDAFLGPTRDPNFTSTITPEAYKEGKIKIAARLREGGPRNSGLVNSYKTELALNPNRYSDREIVNLGDKGLNPGDVLDILEYKRRQVDDLQKMPPGAVTGMELIRQAVPRGFLNTMNDKIRAKLIENEQEYISRVRKAPEKWESIANEISNRWKTVKNPHGQNLGDFKKELNQ